MGGRQGRVSAIQKRILIRAPAYGKNPCMSRLRHFPATRRAMNLLERSIIEQRAGRRDRSGLAVYFP
jgi:hypothetical protein